MVMNTTRLIQRCTLCLVALFITTVFLSGKPKFKSIIIKHKGICYVGYSGMVEKSLPAGKGRLIISIDYLLGGLSPRRYQDEIVGEFDGFHVTNGRVYFNSGSVFYGDLDIVIDVPNIEYHLLNGELESSLYGLYGKKAEVNHCVVLKKPNNSDNGNYSKLFPEVITFNYNSVPAAFQDVEDFKIDSALIRSFIGEDFKITADYSREWAVNDNTLKVLSPLEFNLTANNNISGKVIYGDPNNISKKMFRLSLSNGDSLYVCKEGWDRSVDIVRSTDSARIEYHQARNTSGEKWFQDTFEGSRDYFMDWVSRIDGRKEGSIDSGDNIYVSGRSSYQGYYGHCFTINYDNGSRYQGSLYSDVSAEEPWTFISLIKREITEDDFYFGVYTDNTGDSTIYIKGYPKDVLVNRKAVEDAERQERIRRENEEIERERAAMLAGVRATRSKQAQKYGKKYVDAIYDENRILVGTPEGLLKERYSVFVNSETAKYIVYDIYYASTERFYTVWVDRSTHRVTAVKK